MYCAELAPLPPFFHYCWQSISVGLFAVNAIRFVATWQVQAAVEEVTKLQGVDGSNELMTMWLLQLGYMLCITLKRVTAERDLFSYNLFVAEYDSIVPLFLYSWINAEHRSKWCSSSGASSAAWCEPRPPHQSQKIESLQGFGSGMREGARIFNGVQQAAV